MANEDELRLRIIADTTEFERQMAELGKLSDTVTAGGGKSSGGGKGPDPLKERLDGLRAEIDLTDLSLRKTLTASQRKEQAIRQEASLGKLTQQQMIAGIQAEEQARETATASAIANFDRIESELAQLDQSQQAVINRQKQLFFASERARNGFTTMSGSMTELVSNTKMANITFANFGRIVQDAPFGLLGISNNIDPLLNSFRMLRMEVGGTGAALRAMGAQLLGPAGLIFLLGSLLPTAILFAQKAMAKKRQETDQANNSLTDYERALRSVAQTQLKELAPSTLSYEDQIRALDKALGIVTNSLRIQNREIVNSASFTRNGTTDFKSYIQAQEELALMSRATRDALVDASQGVFGATVEENEAIKEIIQSKLNEAQANKAIADALEQLNLVRRDSTKELEAYVQRYNQLLAQQTLADAQRESVNNEMERLRDEAERFATDYEKIIGRITGARTQGIDDSDFERAVAQEERLFQLRIDTARMTGNEEEAIRLESERRKREATMQFYKLQITDKKAIDAELALIDTETQQQITENARFVAMEKANQLNIVADATNQVLGAVFGENKAVQSAQVVIDTLAGANRAFQEFPAPFGAIAAAANIAYGVATLRKINQTTREKKTLGDTQTASPKLSSLPFATDRPFLATPLASSVASTMMPGNVIPINVEARIDQAGLALAVRRGEGVIASRQIPFAS